MKDSIQTTNTHIVAIGSGLIFILISLLVMSGVFHPIDIWMMESLQQIIPRQFDFVLSFISLFGSFEVIICVLIFMTWRNKKLFFYTLGFFVLGHVLEVGGKMFIPHPSPPVIFHRYDLPFSFASSDFQTGSSYPSGHSFRFVYMMALGIGYMHKFSRNIFICMSIILAILLLSRISLGEHWLSDVVGGGLLGLCLAATVLFLVRFPLFKKKIA